MAYNNCGRNLQSDLFVKIILDKLKSKVTSLITNIKIKSQ